MTHKEILENNKLIAIFMGWVSYVDDGAIQLYKRDGVTKHIGTINYHSSWDSLMPVIKKIHDIYSEWEHEDERYQYVEDNIFWMDNCYAEFMQSDLNSLYTRVVEFIKYHNKNGQ